MTESLLGDAGRAPRLLALTGIRFIAAIAVFNAHLPLPSLAPKELSSFTLAGHDWMTMFFMLSGLILAWNYDDLIGAGPNRAGLRTYFVARFARIYPLYLLALALVMVPLVTSRDGLATLLASGDTWLHVFALQTWSGDLGIAYGYNRPGWSIGVEFFLYALFPIFLALISRLRGRPVALIVLGLSAITVIFAITLAFSLTGHAALPNTDPMSAHRWLYRNPLTRTPDFIVGIVLCYLIKHTSSLSLAGWGRVLQFAGGGLIVVFMALPAIVNSLWSYDSVNVIPWALLMVGLVWNPDTVLARFLGSKPMVFLGECSFAFYLLHQTIIDSIGRTGQGYGAWVTMWLTAFVLTTLIAAGAHLLYERPMRSWIRRRLDPVPAVAPPRLIQHAAGHASA